MWLLLLVMSNYCVHFLYHNFRTVFSLPDCLQLVLVISGSLKVMFMATARAGLFATFNLFHVLFF